MSRFDENHELQLRRAKWLDTILIDYRNAIVRPSTGVSIPNSDVTEVQTTSHSTHNDRYFEQPADLDEPMLDVESVEVEPQPEGPPRRESPPDTGVELEPPHIVQTPRSDPLSRQGDNDLSRQRSSQPRLFITLPARTGPSRDQRFQPYEARSSRSNIQPHRGTPEAPVDAGPQHHTEEAEDQIPEDGETRLQALTSREQVREMTPRLTKWANKKRLPTDFIHALNAGIKAISKLYGVVNEYPCLISTGPATVDPTTKPPSPWKKRNDIVRGLFQELSAYYPVEGERSYWTRTELFAKMMADLEANPDL